MHDPMRRLLPLALVILGVAACGGDDEGGGGEQGASSEACPSGSVEIKMVDIKFEPKDATSSVGQQVCWVNEDTIEHNAVADGGEFESELFGKGKTFTATLDTPGEIPYVCTVHPGMTGTLTVER
jgi:plastocyanin